VAKFSSVQVGVCEGAKRGEVFSPATCGVHFGSTAQWYLARAVVKRFRRCRAKRLYVYQEEKDGEGGVTRLVVSRPGARRAPAPAALGSTEWTWVSTSGDAFWFGDGLEDAW